MDSILISPTTKGLVNSEQNFGQFSKKFWKVSALVSKERSSNQKNKGTISVFFSENLRHYSWPLCK